MHDLYQRPPYWVTVGKRRYRLRPYFNRVLAAVDVLQDENLVMRDKIDTANALLYRIPRKGRPDLLEAALTLLLGKGRGGKSEPVFDFGQDAGYIYAAFRQAYGIDLFRARLHWWEFVALFESLPDNTRMAQIINIRSQPIPARNRYNGESVQHLMRQKALFALKPKEGKDAGLLNMFNALAAMARR